MIQMTHQRYLAKADRTRQGYWPLVVLGLLWLGFVAWRPLQFGFYHDDWSSVATPLDRSGSLGQLLAADPTRPLYLILLYFLRFFLGDNPVAWQVLLAVVQLFNALAIYRLVSCMFADELHRDRRVAATLAAAAWLIFPWSLGYSAWSVMLLPNIGMLLAILGLIQILRKEASTNSVTIALSLFAASWLIYESTWLSWLPFSFLMLARSVRRVQSRPLAWRFFWMSCLLQVAFIVANRVISAQALQSKKLSANILATLSTDRHLFVNQLLPSLPGYLIVGGCLTLLVVCVAVNLQQSLRSPLRPVALLCMVLGLMLSVLIYATAGYAIEWTGLFSRVTLSISFWLSLILASLFVMAWSQAPRYRKGVVLLAILVAMLPLSRSLLEQSRLWSESWREQQAILKALPQNVVDLTNRQSLLLVDIPRGTAPVYTFSAYWDISGAITPRIPNYTVEEKPYAFATVLRAQEWRTTWDGKVVRQYWCTAPDSPLWSMDASRVFLWTYPRAEAEEMQAPFDTGCSSGKKSD